VVARTGRCAIFLLILTLLVGAGPTSLQPIPSTLAGPTASAGFTPAPHFGSAFLG
jgi:hypothetical protein